MKIIQQSVRRKLYIFREKDFKKFNSANNHLRARGREDRQPNMISEISRFA